MKERKNEKEREKLRERERKRGILRERGIGANCKGGTEQMKFRDS